MGDGWIDRVLGDVTPDAKIVARTLLALKTSTLPPHLVRRLPRACDHLTHAAHRLAVTRDHADGAKIVQDVFRGDGLLADSAFRKRHVLRNVPVQMVAH